MQLGRGSASSRGCAADDGPLGFRFGNLDDVLFASGGFRKPPVVADIFFASVEGEVGLLKARCHADDVRPRLPIPHEHV